MGEQLRDIRRAIAIGLRNPGGDPVIPAAEGRIYAGRTRPFDKAKLPAVNVTTERDRVTEMRSDSPPEYWRTATVGIDVVIAAEPDESVHDGLETDLLDEIGQQIEDFMGSIDLPRQWQCSLKSFETAVKFEADRALVIGRWEWDWSYFEKMPRNPDLSSLVPFETLLAEWDLAHSSADLEATDEVAIPQD